MNDFKIGDDIKYKSKKEINEELSKKRNKKVIVLIILVILIGITTSIVSYKLLNNNKKEEPIKTEIDINDQNIKLLYEYVTYGTEGKRNTKFLEEKNVTLKSFSPEEKYYYALQFIDSSDIESTNQYTKDNNKIYTLSEEVLKQSMVQFFGPKITYSKNIDINYTFPFLIDKKNTARLYYDSYNNGLNIVFTSNKDIQKESNTVKEINTKLKSATQDEEGNITIKEQVLYQKLTQNDDNTYKIETYKDFNKGILIDIEDKLTKEYIDNYKIDFSKYNNTTIIEYNFKVYNNTYYFDSSKIIV